jgi:hypothetical protein
LYAVGSWKASSAALTAHHSSGSSTSPSSHHAAALALMQSSKCYAHFYFFSFYFGFVLVGRSASALIDGDGPASSWFFISPGMTIFLFPFTSLPLPLGDGRLHALPFKVAMPAVAAVPCAFEFEMRQTGASEF